MTHSAGRSQPVESRTAARAIAAFGLVPIGLYLGTFCLYTFPLVTRFSSHFFVDLGDGLWNIWNLWWFKKAVLELHQSPWFTNLIHFPSGVSLAAHTLSPFNGALGSVLQTHFTLVQSLNFIVLFAFVASGMTAFLLAHYVTRSYPGALLAGFVFTFSSYHFAHAEGHLNLISMQWIPLFLLAWLALLDRPSRSRALAASVSLGLFHQVQHERPIAFGPIARLPRSVWEQNEQLRQLVDRRDFSALCERHGFRHVVVHRPEARASPNAREVFADEAVSVLELDCP